MKSPSFIHSHTLDIASPYKAILLDAYGVFWEGGTGVMGDSPSTMEALINSGKTVGILSNSSQPASKEIKKLESHGLKQGTHFHFLMTSGEAAKHIFLEGDLPFKVSNNKYWVFGGRHPKFGAPHEVIFQETAFSSTENVEEADFIYISIPHLQGQDQTSVDVFEEEVKALVKSNLPMVCANPDSFAFEGIPPQLVVRQGSIAHLYQKWGGTVFTIGKPEKIVYEIALEQFAQFISVSPSEILMVGDTPETDIRGANRAGLASALVVSKGIAGARVEKLGWDAFIQGLPSTDVPTYYIHQFMTN